MSWGKPIFATESKNEQRLINQFNASFFPTFFWPKENPFFASTCSAFHWRRSLHFLINKCTFNLSLFVFNINRKRWIYQELVIIRKVKGEAEKCWKRRKEIWALDCSISVETFSLTTFFSFLFFWRVWWRKRNEKRSFQQTLTITCIFEIKAKSFILPFTLHFLFIICWTMYCQPTFKYFFQNLKHKSKFILGMHFLIWF